MKPSCFVCLLALACRVRAKTEIEQEFGRFLEKFGKVYKSAAEKAERLAIFTENFNFIEEENLRGLPYTVGMNEFADMSPVEFKAQYLQYETPTSNELYGGLPHLGTHRYSGALLPDAVDWAAKGAVTPVKNQQKCGSCWAFSTTGSLESAWQIATGTLVSLSEQQLMDCSHNGTMGCHGGIIDNSFLFDEGANICTEQSYPYTAQNGSCQAASCTTAIPAGSVTGYKDVASRDTDALKEAVSKHPVTVVIGATDSAFQFYKSGVLTQNSGCGELQNHGVVVVGYGTDSVKGFFHNYNVSYWKVKNSWGSTWGEKGYVRIERGEVSEISVCGIEMSPSYPVVRGKPGQVLI